MSGLEGLLAGRTLAGRYQIREVIGRGGMGAVYRATDERLGRQVAVKVITAAAADPESRDRIRARFRHEAAAAARLPHHPNVVPVYDYGTDETLELDFLVMELLRGEPLSGPLGRGERLSLPASLAVLRDAARGVAVGHRAGVIHRDIKPGNIFLVRDEATGEVQVRVLDFGIAKVLDEEDTFTQLTRHGQAPLSPGYASPEQLRSHPRVTASSDVFSLGVVGFQMLTGQRPFSEEERNRLAAGESVPAPSVRTRAPEVPAEVDEIIQRALAADVAARYENASELSAAVGRELRGIDEHAADPAAPIPADVLPASVAADRTLPEPPADATVPIPPEEEDEGTLPAAPPVPGGEGAAAPPLQQRPPLSPRRRPPERQRTHPVQWLTIFLLLATLGFGAWYAFLREEEPGITILPPEEVEVEEPDIEEPDEPDELTAFFQNQEGARLLNLGFEEEALEHFTRAVEISPNNAEFRQNRGNALLRLGRTEEAVAELDRAVRLEPGRANAYALLGRGRLVMGDTVVALEAFRQFLDRSDDPRRRAEIEEQVERIMEAREAPPPEPPEEDPPPLEPTTPPDTLRR